MTTQSTTTKEALEPDDFDYATRDDVNLAILRELEKIHFRERFKQKGPLIAQGIVQNLIAAGVDFSKADFSKVTEPDRRRDRCDLRGFQMNSEHHKSCLNCGHDSIDGGGFCTELVLGPNPLAGMIYCGCKCVFPAAPASSVDPQQSKARYEKAHEARYSMTHPVHPDIVVLWFLALKSHWFENPDNLFYGQREAAKAYLYKWVETGELAEDRTTLEIAMAGKFREWLASSWTAVASPTALRDEAEISDAAAEVLNLAAKRVKC